MAGALEALPGVAALAVLTDGAAPLDAVAADVPAPAEAGVPAVGVGAAPVAAVGETVGSAVKVTLTVKVKGHAPEPLLEAVALPVVELPPVEDCRVTFVTPSMRASRCIV